MKKTLFITILSIISTVLFAVSSAFSQEVSADNELKISGALWMGVHMNLSKDQGNATDLQLDKVQVNFDKKVNDTFSAAVKIQKMPVSNVNGYITSDTGQRVYVGNVGFGMYLREATIKYTPINGPLSAYVIAGIPETPTGQFISGLKSDYQFNIHETEFTEKFTSEKNYDAAVGFGMKYEKLVDAYFTVGHGDGYKNLGGANAPDYKYSYNGRITVCPIDALKISGFFSMDNHKAQDEWVENHEDVILEGAFEKTSTAALKAGIQTAATTYGFWNSGDVNEDGYSNNADYADALIYLSGVNATMAAYKKGIIDKYVDSTDIKSAFYGSGIGWNDGSIRAGFNYFYLTQEIAGEKSEVDGDQVFDFWANANLKQIIGVPVAVYTGYSIMKDKDTKVNGVSVEEEGKAVDHTEWFAGAGYEFNGEAGMYLFYRHYEEDISGADPEKNIKFVTTLKF